MTTICTVLLGGGLLAVPVALGADEGFLQSALLAVAAPAVLLLYLTVRGLRIGLVANDDGIVVRNALRTTRWAWSDVAELVVEPGPWYWQSSGGQIALTIVGKTGRRVSATGTLTLHTRSYRLSADLAPVFALAEPHGVGFESNELTHEQLAKIRQKLAALRIVAGVARMFQ